MALRQFVFCCGAQSSYRWLARGTLSANGAQCLPVCYRGPQLRLMSSSTTSHRKSLYKTEKARKIRFYVLESFENYMTKYNGMLEKRFPTAMKLYRVFVDGAKGFYGDVKEFVRVTRLLRSKINGLNCLTLKELELYHRMPKDMYRVAPVLIASTLPLANYVIFPLIYLFPRQLLSGHFWNLQQRAEFTVHELRGRLKHNRLLYRHLQNRRSFIPNEALYVKWDRVLGSLSSGVHPEVDEIVKCKDLFSWQPFHLIYLTGGHKRELLAIFDMHRGPFRESRLEEFGKILLAMDKAIVLEGGVDAMSVEALRNACVIRGLNPTNMKTEDLVDWLKRWLYVSKHVDNTCLSMLLHSPIMLGYNEPTNRLLISQNN